LKLGLREHLDLFNFEPYHQTSFGNLLRHFFVHSDVKLVIVSLVLQCRDQEFDLLASGRLLLVDHPEVDVGTDV